MSISDADETKHQKDGNNRVVHIDRDEWGMTQSLRQESSRKTESGKRKNWCRSPRAHRRLNHEAFFLSRIYHSKVIPNEGAIRSILANTFRTSKKYLDFRPTTNSHAQRSMKEDRQDPHPLDNSSNTQAPFLVISRALQGPLSSHESSTPLLEIRSLELIWVLVRRRLARRGIPLAFSGKSEARESIIKKRKVLLRQDLVVCTEIEALQSVLYQFRLLPLFL